MSKSLLIFSWEYPGVNSARGAALSRRIGQVAEGFATQGWKVNIIHKNHINENIQNIQEGIKVNDYITRYPVVGPAISPESSLSRFSFLRRLATFYYIIFKGDRSFKWAQNALKFIKKDYIAKPDLIIGFYSPKGPLLAASLASKHFGIPWFADLQDPIYDGGKKILGDLNYIWSQKILKTSSSIFHVSPEWAEETSKIVNKEVFTIRHSIPNSLPPQNQPKTELTYSILYGGSMHREKQSPVLLLKALKSINQSADPKIRLQLAASESVFTTFKLIAQEISYDIDLIEWLGWLSQSQLQNAFKNSDCLILIPWKSKDRIVVPSKLYEYMAYPKPILIAGPDSGAVASLLNEWQHPNVVCDTQGKIESAITKLYEGDPSHLLTRDLCINPLEEENIAQLYINKFNELIKK